MTQTANSRETEHGRMYDWKNDSFPSVTQIIKDGLAKPGLIPWAAKQVAKDAADRAAELAAMKTKKARFESLMDAFDHGRGNQGVTGTIVHGHADSIAKGEDMSSVVYPEEVYPFMESFGNFLKDFNPVFLESEAFVSSRTYQYSGTLDSIIAYKGINYVLDIKTGNSVWPEVGLQLAAYARADFIGRKSGEESELPVLHKKWGLVLHLRPEGYTLRRVRIDDEVFDAFLACIDMHHYQKFTQHYILGERMTP